VLDPATRQLVRDGQPVHLTPKAFDLLEALVSCRPRVLTKAEARERLWPGTHVADGNLANLVKEVREALADDARNPRYVRTVHGVGHAFCGDARGDDPDDGATGGDPALVFRLEWDGGLIALAEGEYLLGRHPRSVVPTASETVSRRHARLRIADGRAVLEDLGSRHGTFVAGQRIEAPRALSDGERFRLGPLHFTLRTSQPSFEETQDVTLDARPPRARRGGGSPKSGPGCRS
jgi:DNA-binding winged helix-turn-helix (wHTH) protein